MREMRPPDGGPVYQWLEIAAGIIAVAAIMFAIWAVFSGQTSRPSEKNDSADLPGKFYPSLGNHHLMGAEGFNDYNSYPPTSGPHLPDAAPWGILKAPVDDRRLLENMEQGGVVVWYDPSDPPGLVSSLRATVRRYLDQGRLLVMLPSSDVDRKVVLGSWTRLMKLDRFDEEAIRSFIDVHERRYTLRTS